MDREKFSALMTEKIMAHPLITVEREEVTELPAEDPVIVATGPLTSQALSDAIGKLCGERYLSFYDASAPIVTYESLDHEKTFFATRYERGDADYINCPFTQEEYERFYEALITAKTVD